MIKLIVSIVTSLAIALFVLIPFSEVSAAPYGVGLYSANVPYGGQTQLTIATSGNISLSVAPTSSGALVSSSGTVTITSSDVVGYKLYIRSTGSTDMVNGGAVIPASANGSPAALAVNTWGYNLDGSADFTGMTLSDVLIRNRTGPYTSGDVTTVTYGVNVDNAKLPGSYSNTVIYTAVPQTN